MFDLLMKNQLNQLAKIRREIIKHRDDIAVQKGEFAQSLFYLSSVTPSYLLRKTLPLGRDLGHLQRLVHWMLVAKLPIITQFPLRTDLQLSQLCRTLQSIFILSSTWQQPKLALQQPNQFFNNGAHTIHSILNCISISQMDFNFEHFISIMRNRVEATLPKLTTIDIEKCSELRDKFNDLPAQLKDLFRQLFNSSQKQITLKELLPFKSHPTSMPICNKLLKSQQMVYRCYDCSNHEASVFCISCFQNGNHKGHRFTKIQSGGGNCDCGNPDAILPHGFCINHKGTIEYPMIEQQDEYQFNLYMQQLFIWTFTLLNQNLKVQSQTLLLHLLVYLSELNEQSLHYNLLTNGLLFGHHNKLINHIFIIGAPTNQALIAKKATELFLKMFSLEQFKENLASAYLFAYNNIGNFQHSKFQSLFIQLFANNDLVEKVIMRDRISLDPRGRRYQTSFYYSSLKFIGTIKQRSAKIFFIPIIERGGVDFQFLQVIEEGCEKEGREIQSYYRAAQQQEYYFQIIYVVVKLIKDDPQLLRQEIRNQYRLINKYSFRKNKVFLDHQRAFVICVFAYFRCDLAKVDPQQLADVLEISTAQLVDLFQKLISQFIGCLGQLATCLAHMAFKNYAFSDYLTFYTQKGNKFIIMDQLGLKLAAILLDKLLLPMKFSETIFGQYVSQKTTLLNSNAQPKQIQRRHTIFSLKWVNLMWLMTETVCFDRSQIMIANTICLGNEEVVLEMNRQQLKQIFSNIREISQQNLDVLAVFLFQTTINKKLLAEIATFDKSKKKFVVNQNMVEQPLKLQYLRSFLMTPQTHLLPTGSYEITVTEKMRKFRAIFFPEIFLQHLYESLLSYLECQAKQQRLKYLRDMSTQLKSMHYFFQGNSDALDQIMKHKIIALLDKQKGDSALTAEIKQNLLVGSDCKFNVVDEKQLQKRKLILKQKKEEKLKSIKAKTDLSKHLLKSIKEEEPKHMANEEDNCIVCHEKDKESPYCYLAELHMSNIIYSELKLEGRNSFFNCCFHTVHFSCFQSLSGTHERILCPLCKSIANFALPTETTLKRVTAEQMQAIQAPIQRMEMVLLSEASKESIHDFLFQIMKSYLQLFFSSIAEQKQLSEKQIKLFRIISDIIKIHYSAKSEEERFILQEEASLLSDSYKGNQQNCGFNLSQFIDLIFSLVFWELDQNFDAAKLTETIKKCDKLHRQDVEWCFTIGNKLFGRFYNVELGLDHVEFDLAIHPLSSLIHFYQPPKTTRQLLQNRRKEKQVCKSGHNICVCVVCEWQGCLDCAETTYHSLKYHNTDTLFFSLLTTGFYYSYKGTLTPTHSFYFNDTGVMWMPQYGQDDYFFDQENYQKILQALKSGRLMHYIRQNYQSLKQRGAWSL